MQLSWRDANEARRHAVVKGRSEHISSLANSDSSQPLEASTTAIKNEVQDDTRNGSRRHSRKQTAKSVLESRRRRGVCQARDALISKKVVRNKTPPRHIACVVYNPVVVSFYITIQSPTLHVPVPPQHHLHRKNRNSNSGRQKRFRKTHHHRRRFQALDFFPQTRHFD